MKRVICSLSGLIALIAVSVSCSKEEDSLSMNAPSTTAEFVERQYPGALVPLDLDFEMNLSDDEARAFNLSYDANNKKKPNLNLSVNSTVRGRIYIAARPKNSTQNIAENMFSRANADFTIKSVSADGKRIRFTFTNKAWINGYVESTKNNYDWYMSAVFGESQKINANTRHVEFAPFPRNEQVTLTDNTTQTIESLRVSEGMLPVPYGFGWTKFTWSNLQGLYTDAEVKPLGVLLRFNIKNEISSTTNSEYLRNYRIHKIEFQSSTLFPKAKFNPSLTNAAITGKAITWENAHTGATWTYQPNIVGQSGRRSIVSIPSIDTAPNGSDYFFVWFANTQAANNSLRITIHGEGTGKARTTYAYTTNLSLVNNRGTSPTRTLRLVPMSTVNPNERLVHPMFWLAADLGNVGEPESFRGLEMANEWISGYKDFSAFYMVKPEETTGVHYYGARNDKRNGEINRYLPTAMDWMTILPVQHYDRQNVWSWYGGADYYQFGRSTAKTVNKNGSNARRDFAMARTTLGRHRPYYIDADYYYAGNMQNKMYGLRFKGTAYADPNFQRGELLPAPNEFRSAWRYTYEPNQGLRIDIVHIGAEDPYLNKTDVQLSDIANDEYFTMASRMGRMITHYLPLGGNAESARHARYLTSTMHDQGRSVSYISIAPEGIHLETQNRAQSYARTHSKVRFFIVNPFDGVEDSRPGLQAADIANYRPQM